MDRTLQEHRALVRQSGLDAAVPLLNARQSVLSCVDKHGKVRRNDIDLVAIGIDEMREAMVQRSLRRNEVLSVSAMANLECLNSSLEEDLWAVTKGRRVKGLFNQDGCDLHVQDFMNGLPPTPYYFCLAPMQMKILDRREVIIEGPTVGGERTILAVGAPEVVKAAWHYWRRVSEGAVPVSAIATPNPAAHLTRRQRDIVELMADDLSDHVIAKRLEVSVRTVRYEIATIMRLVDARSRFGAGFRLGRHSLEHMDAPAPAQSTTRAGSNARQERDPASAGGGGR